MDFSNMSVGKKSTLLISAIGFTIIFLSAIGMWFYIMELEKNEYDKIRKNMQLLLKKELSLKESVSISNAVGISSNQNIIESLSSGDRKKALKTIEGIGLEYKEKTPFKNIKVHVHTKDVKSFVRGWKPDKFGDDLSSFRHTINKVKSSGKPITAMEVGRAGMTLRSVVPVNDQSGRYVGSLEFIQGLNSVQKTLKKDGIDFLLLMHKSGIKDAKQLSTKTAVGDYLLDLKSYDKDFLKYATSIDLSKMDSNSYYIDENYYVTALEVKDFRDKTIGLYLLGEDIDSVSSHVNQSKALIYSFLALSTLLVVFIISVVLISNHFMMVKPIVSSVEEIIEASSQINDASTQIADSSISLAEDSSIQSKNVDDINETIVYAADENDKNSKSINEATRLARITDESANDGSNKINNLVISMDEITKASEQIHKIVKTIDEIASQTHLLALNAAVEAARAGEHGLGFAVVADEVKALAGRSATAARETTGIIETTISLIEQGSSNADESKQAFVTILENAKQTASLIHEISDSIHEQTTKMNSIKTSMSEIDVNIQSNATISEEMAASSEELNAQTVTLKNTINNVGKLVGYSVE